MSHNADSNYDQDFTFECHLFDAARRAKNSGLDLTSPLFQQFAAWMDMQLADLERRFGHFATPNSNRGYYSR